jgi:DNA-directed RNA polymerase specialized sigma24 family protein
MNVAGRTRILQTACVQEAVNAAADSDVLRRVAGRDKAALGILHDRRGGVMRALGVCIVGVRRDAEDPLHEVFLEAWRLTRSITHAGIRALGQTSPPR